MVVTEEDNRSRLAGKVKVGCENLTAKVTCSCPFYMVSAKDRRTD